MINKYQGSALRPLCSLWRTGHPRSPLCCYLSLDFSFHCVPNNHQETGDFTGLYRTVENSVGHTGAFTFQFVPLKQGRSDTMTFMSMCNWWPTTTVTSVTPNMLDTSPYLCKNLYQFVSFYKYMFVICNKFIQLGELVYMCIAVWSFLLPYSTLSSPSCHNLPICSVINYFTIIVFISLITNDIEKDFMYSL